MGVIYVLGVSFFCISVWGVIQLSLLGFFYGLEASTLIDDIKTTNFTDFESYLVKTRDVYYTVSDNCYFAAYAYVPGIVLSWMITFLGKYFDKRAALKLLGEDKVALQR